MWQDPLTIHSKDFQIQWAFMEVSDPPQLFVHLPAGLKHMLIRSGPYNSLKERSNLLDVELESLNDTLIILDVPLLQSEIQVLEIQVFSPSHRLDFRDRKYFRPALLAQRGQWTQNYKDPLLNNFAMPGSMGHWKMLPNQDPWQLYYCQISATPALPPHYMAESVEYATDWSYCTPLMKLDQPEMEIQFRSAGQYIAKSPDGMVEIMYIPEDPDFPSLTSPEVLIEVARYLVRDDEFKELQNAANPKEALDRFWLQWGDFPDRARTLIAQYYGRAESANQLFTDGKPGWMTDRGMAYIIFGPPDLAVADYHKIAWSYPKFSDLKLEFYFENGQWHLTRNREHQMAWNMAVHAWRQGRVP